MYTYVVAFRLYECTLHFYEYFWAGNASKLFKYWWKCWLFRFERTTAILKRGLNGSSLVLALPEIIRKCLTNCISTTSIYTLAQLVGIPVLWEWIGFRQFPSIAFTGSEFTSALKHTIHTSVLFSHSIRPKALWNFDCNLENNSMNGYYFLMSASGGKCTLR